MAVPGTMYSDAESSLLKFKQTQWPSYRPASEVKILTDAESLNCPIDNCGNRSMNRRQLRIHLMGSHAIVYQRMKRDCDGDVENTLNRLLRGNRGKRLPVIQKDTEEVVLSRVSLNDFSVSPPCSDPFQFIDRMLRNITYAAPSSDIETISKRTPRFRFRDKAVPYKVPIDVLQLDRTSPKGFIPLPRLSQPTPRSVLFAECYSMREQELHANIGLHKHVLHLLARLRVDDDSTVSKILRQNVTMLPVLRKEGRRSREDAEENRDE